MGFQRNLADTLLAIKSAEHHDWFAQANKEVM